MDVVAWIENLVTMVFQQSAMPSWLVALLIDLMKRYLTPDMVTKVENEITCYVCSKMKAAMPNPSPAEAQVMAMLNQLLSCQNCAPAAQAAPVAAPAP